MIIGVPTFRLRGTYFAIGTLGLAEVLRITTATQRGDTWVLDGLKPAVIDGHTADWAIVAARTDDGLSSFLIEKPGGEVVPSLDAEEYGELGLLMQGRQVRMGHQTGPDVPAGERQPVHSGA